MTIVEVMNIQLHFKVRGVMRNLHPTTMPLWSLLGGIQSNAALAETTAAGRSLPADEFKAWKPRNLMSVYLAAKYKDRDGRAEEENLCGYTGLAPFDFDDVEIADTMAKLRCVPQVVCAAVSASGKGVWGAARVACATKLEYHKCFAEGIRVFKEAGLSGLDAAADPTRARFVSASPECWWRFDAVGDVPAFEPVGDLMLLESPTKAKRREKVKLPSGYNQMSLEVGFDEARLIIQGAKDVPDGEHNTAKAVMCGQLKSLAARVGVNPSAYAGLFISAWDEVGSTHKKTVSMCNRLLLGADKKGKKE